MPTSSLVAATPSTAESLRIQVVRGITCSLVIMMHVIGTQPETGMHVGDGSGWRTFFNLWWHFQMPLFAFISGFAYAYRPVRPGQQKSFLRGKVLRLLLPLVFVSTLYYISELLHPNPNMPPQPLFEMWRIFVFPYYHLWFLQAIMMIFLAITVLETARALDTPWRAVVMLAITFVLPFYFSVQNDWFSVVGLVRLLPFFILGLSINRFRHLLQHPALPWMVTAVFVLAMGRHWLGVLGILDGPVPRMTPLATVIGISTVLTLWYWVPRVTLLERIGNYSFPIFAYHVFFVAIAREVLRLAHITNSFVVFFTCFACGLMGPIIMSTIVERVSIGRRIVLGRA